METDINDNTYLVEQVCADCRGYGVRVLGCEPARWDGQQYIPGDDICAECLECDGCGIIAHELSADDGPQTDDPWPPEDDAIMEWIRQQEAKASPEGAGDWIERYAPQEDGR